MFGKIQFEEFKSLEKMPQAAASAWGAAANIVGASYKPLLYVGSQVVNGTNYFFIAEQTLLTNPPVKRLVLVVLNGGSVVAINEILG